MIPFNNKQIAGYEAVGAWTELTLHDYFLRNVKSNASAIAVVDAANREQFSRSQPRRLSYAELHQQVEAIAVALHRSGISAGDVVLVQLPNIWELVAIYLAVARLGAIISPVAIQFRAKELENIIALTAPRAFITTSSFKGVDHAEYFKQRFAAFAGKLISVDGGEMAEVVNDEFEKNTHPLQVLSLQAMTDGFAAADSSELSHCKPEANALFSVCWTSGTEGIPKGVPRTHNNWRCSGMTVSEGYGLDGQECLLLPFPLINTAAIGGVLIPWLQCGGKLVLHHPFDVDVFLQQLVSEQVTTALAAPALLDSLLAKPDLRELLKNSALKRVGTGSAPPSPKMLREFQEQLGISVINMFGSNEGVLLCSDHHLMPDPEQRAKFFPRLGADNVRPTSGTGRWISSKLLDPESGQLIDQPGRPGELAIKGPSIFFGYYNLGQFDRSKFDEEGFFYTGDLFEITEDDEGVARFYRAVGRQKDIIIRGGFNISPVELDNLLADIPGVREVAVAGYPDQRLGERICAYLVPEQGETITLDTMSRFLEARGLARYKWPERLVLLDSLPRNALNKVVRRELNDLMPITD